MCIVEENVIKQLSVSFQLLHHDRNSHNWTQGSIRNMDKKQLGGSRGSPEQALGSLTCLSASFSRVRNRSSRSTQCGRSVWPRNWASSRRCLSSRRVPISSFSCRCRVLEAWRSSSRSREVRAMSSARDDLQGCGKQAGGTSEHTYQLGLVQSSTGRFFHN